ncbi:MAG TPA: hypothetical protein VMZ73_05075, partial [Acidimicrobiales bacterium]|nr:hypothetical protein [Acidimicrobiales bacterium]
ETQSPNGSPASPPQETSLTGTDGAIRFRPRPAEGPLPEMLASLEAEFFVDWQVAAFETAQAPTGPFRPA